MRLWLQPLGWIGRNPLRVYFVAIALAVVPLSFFLAAAHRMFTRQATSRLVQQGKRSGEMIGAQVQRHLSGTAILLESLTLRPDFAENWEHGKYAELSNALEHLHRLQAQFALLGVCDLEGNLRSASPHVTALINTGFSDRDWYKGVRRNWDPYVSSVYPARLPPHAPLVTVAVPLRDAAGKPIGIVVASETLDAVTKEVYGLVSPENAGLIFFVDQKGQVFGQHGDRVEPADLQPAVSSLGGPRESTSSEVRLNGRKYVIAYSPIPQFGWGVLIQVPESVTRAALWQYERPIALLGAIIILLALAAGALLAYLYGKLRMNEQRYLRQIEKQNRQLEHDQREAENANQMKSRFLASMSHELRTPLNAILGFASLLQDSLSELPKQRRWADRVHEAGGHLLQLISDILDLSKIEAGRMDLQWQVFSANSAVPEVMAVLEPLITAKQIDVHIQIEPDLRVSADRVRFKQVLYNLLSNAVKFTPSGGTVRLRGQSHRQDAVFTVEDTGIGIAAEHQQRIFSEFNRLNSEAEGTGLGLAISRKLVEQHGGTLGVESEIGRGSKFTFTVPLASDEVAAIEKSHPRMTDAGDAQ
jgi:signal transduction histidine kinase